MIGIFKYIIGVLKMKHISRILVITFAMQGISSYAQMHQTMVQQSSSQQVSSQLTPQGGSVTIGGQTFHTEPGQSITVQGGGMTAQTQTTKIGDEPAVTVTEVEKRPLTVTVDGETTVIDDPSSTTVTIDGEPIDLESNEQREGVIRRTGEATAQATRDAVDVAAQATEGALDTVSNFFGGLFGR